MIVILGLVLFLGLIRIITYKNVFGTFYTALCSFMLFLFISLRSIEFGSDTIGYVKKYETLAGLPFRYFFFNWINGTGKDPFFNLASKTISLLGADYRIWIAILSGLFVIALYFVISKYSVEPYISFLIIISMGFLFFSMTGLRQTVSLSFILFSFKYLRERKKIPFIFCVLIGALFHSSALVFLISYPISKFKLSFRHFIGLGIMLFLVMNFGDSIKSIISSIVFVEKWQHYFLENNVLNYSGFLIQFFVFIFCFYYSKNVLNNSKENIDLYNILYLGLVFQALSGVIAEFFRISMYFSIFSILLIPIAINSETNSKVKYLIYYTLVIIFLTYIIRSNSYHQYRFLWE